VYFKILFRGRILIGLLFLLFAIVARPQQEVTIMTYNLLKFSENSSDRLPYFKTILDSLQPDILVVQEIFSQPAINLFHQQVLNASYAKGDFIDGPDSDNALFYKYDRFEFISNTPIATDLRNISEFKLVFQPNADTLRIYSVHLKASSGSANENLRLEEVNLLRASTNILPVGSNFIVCGDFNIYKSSEPSYQALLADNGINEGHFIDPITMTGTWNNPAYAQHHTQSPRARSFGGGASGGLDDRFDLILFSSAISNPGGMDYVAGSTWAVGNDGNHYNDSINRPPNARVSQALANALHYASDHLPVIAKFTFQPAAATQTYALEEGWNGISSYLAPHPAAIGQMVEQLGDRFVALLNEEGIYFPGGGLYQIENWDSQSGYAIKVNEATPYIVYGTLPGSPALEISAGWNLLPAPFTSPQSVESFFGAHLSSIEVVKNALSTHIYWPAMGIHTLESIKPGDAYWVKSYRSFTLIPGTLFY